MFNGSFKEGVESNVTVQNIDSDTLEAIIRFIYCGSVEISSIDNAIELLKSAHLMELPHLMTYSEEYILSEMSGEACFEVFFQTKLFNIEYLSSKAKNGIAKEFKNFSQKDYFKQLDKDQFLELIVEFQKIACEDDIAEGILAWIDHDKDRMEHFEEFLRLLEIEDILRDVSFSIITLSHRLVNLIDSELCFLDLILKKPCFTIEYKVKCLHLFIV